MLPNSDNVSADLAFCQNVKQAAKRGVGGSGTIYDDLKTRFPGRRRKEDSIPQPTMYEQPVPVGCGSSRL